MSSKPPDTEQQPSFPALVQEFFTHYLVGQRALSPRTVAGYRDAFTLFLTFAHRHLGTCPAAMSLADITPALILAFLDHLEQERHNGVRSRNVRLAALRAFLKFASHRAPSALQTIEQALAVPMKRSEQPMRGFLSRDEMLAVIGPPGTSLDRPARPPVAGPALQHGGAGVGGHQRESGGCGAGRRAPCPFAWQRSQAAGGTVVEVHSAGNPGMASA